MEDKQIVIISGYRPKDSLTHVNRLYLNSDIASARRQFEDDNGLIMTWQTIDSTNIIEWRSTLSGVQYLAVLS